MARMRVEIDGVEKFDGYVPDAHLPEKPDTYPSALGATGRPSPLARAYLLGVTAMVLAQWIQQQPLLQPVDVETDMDAATGGFTLTVSGPVIDLSGLQP